MSRTTFSTYTYFNLCLNSPNIYNIAYDIDSLRIIVSRNYLILGNVTLYNC